MFVFLFKDRSRGDEQMSDAAILKDNIQQTSRVCDGWKLCAYVEPESDVHNDKWRLDNERWERLSRRAG